MCFPPFSAVASLEVQPTTHIVQLMKNSIRVNRDSALDDKDIFNVPFVFVPVVVCILIDWKTTLSNFTTTLLHVKLVIFQLHLINKRSRKMNHASHV